MYGAYAAHPGALERATETGLAGSLGGLLEQLSQLVRELPADGASRLQQWARDPALPRELRCLAVHLPER